MPGGAVERAYDARVRSTFNLGGGGGGLVFVSRQGTNGERTGVCKNDGMRGVGVVERMAAVLTIGVNEREGGIIL